MNLQRRRWLFGAAAALIASLTGCASAPSAAVRQALAPSGTLRIAVYPGSPTSMVRAPGSDEMRGVSIEVGRDLARRLGVPADVIVFQRVAEVIEALKAGRADFTITNATPARAQDVDFTPPLLAIELGYLALADSPVQSLADVDQAGVRIGVTQGSTSQGVLSRQYKLAQIVTAPSLQAAAQMLQKREIEAYATNKAVLFELADNVPGARVLPGRWGLEHLAIAVPKGRDAGTDTLRRFADSVRRDGLVRDAAARAGLRGSVEAAEQGR